MGLEKENMGFPELFLDDARMIQIVERIKI
jgi:hypothetical protein